MPLDNNPDHWGTNPGHRDRFIVFGTSGQFFGTSGQIFGTSGQILGPSGQILGPSGQFIGPSGQILGTIGTNLKKFTRSSPTLLYNVSHYDVIFHRALSNRKQRIFAN